MDAGVKKYQGQVFASQQSFDSNIKSLFPHRIPTFFILFILKWEKFLADIYVWTSDGASIIHMLFLKSWKGKYLTSKHVSFQEFKSLMFEGRMDKTAWQRPEFEANNPKFDKFHKKKKTLRLLNLISSSNCLNNLSF